MSAESFSDTPAAQEAARARVIIPPIVQRHNPAFEPAIRAQMGSDIRFASATKEAFSDESPWVKISETNGMSVALVATTMCGGISESALMETAMIGHTIFTEDPTAERLVAISNAENRGDKKTLDVNGNPIDKMEHQFAYYMAEMLRGPGHVDRIITLDPHSAAFSDAFGAQDVIAISPLPEIAQYMQERGLITPESALVAPDAGGIGRTILFSQITGLPIVGFIEKERRNGKVGIKKLHGHPDEIRGRRLILADDILASGSTAGKDSRFLKDLGALSIDFAATHVAKVPGNREAVGNLIQENTLRSVITTNSSSYQESLSGLPGVHFVDALSIVAKAGHALLTPSRLDLQDYLNAHRYEIVDPEINIDVLRQMNPNLLRDLPSKKTLFNGNKYDPATLIS